MAEIKKRGRPTKPIKADTEEQAKRLRRMERDIAELHKVQSKTVLLVCDIARQLPQNPRLSVWQRVKQWLER